MSMPEIQPCAKTKAIRVYRKDRKWVLICETDDMDEATQAFLSSWKPMKALTPDGKDHEDFDTA